ncbi:MAG: glycosyltransferase family 2 protein [Deltaproteobacteria bacterium]|nr:glycosyltransferase family 2 protein [Deltaproteobacteria bacterium]
MKLHRQSVAVVIPCYRARAYILDVIASIGALPERIWVVDDCCPEATGAHVAGNCSDPRVKILSHDINLGVGGAVKSGYRAALSEGSRILVKIDGDGQMDSSLLPDFVARLQEYDYVKGNRFGSGSRPREMPLIRYAGNRWFSCMSRLSTGYYHIGDVLNGYTAIRSEALQRLPLDRIANDYFFESDMLFQLALNAAKVGEIPTPCRYQGETSSLSIFKTLVTFPPRYISRALYRLCNNCAPRTHNLM